MPYQRSTVISRKEWLHEHHRDQYVRRAKEEQYRSRAAFKLLELQQKDHLLLPGQTVLDLGAAPGGWSQVAMKLAGPKGKVVAVDQLMMPPIPGVVFVHGDLADTQIQEQLAGLIFERIDLILSDMAPNISGNSSRDQAQIEELANLALACAEKYLKKKGSLLLKIFHGEALAAVRKEMSEKFAETKVRKPQASRARSSEMYLYGKGYLGAR